MKLNIDLEELFLEGNENGLDAKSAIRKAVVDQICEDIWPGCMDAARAEIAANVAVQIAPVIQEQLKVLFADLMDYEFEEVSAYGAKNGKWTVRKRILDCIEKTCIITRGSYYDTNKFTEAVTGVVSSAMEGFKKEFTAAVNKELTVKAMAFAVEELSKKLTPVKQ